MFSNQSQTVATMATASIRAKQQTKFLEGLPPEINNMITKLLLEDPMFCAWFQLRSVCRYWKAEIERLFRAKYLSNTNISVHNSYSLVEKLEFDRVLEDNVTAVFKIPDRKYSFFNYWIEEVISPECIFYGTFYLVTVADEACSDPKLHGIQVDSEAKSVSLPWVPMMNQLLGDEVRLRRRAISMCSQETQPIRRPETPNHELFFQAPLKLASSWVANPAMRPMLLYTICRHRTFEPEVYSVWESRVRRQYHLSEEQKKALSRGDGLLGPGSKVRTMFNIRKAFRSKWTKMVQ
ncbi:hypothetical protein Daesc_003287 [Daldinia eschscholtzii]|uniref:F-box domain-containing protein n=1 Tax=Daldinia eschscholtzii TaxID=292717 RepID=A0AAX6MSP4_9PEZI